MSGLQRLDKWLCCARFMKSRTLAAAMIEEGRVRINGARALKPSLTVREGDVLVISYGPKIQTIRILNAADRRGPASEARTLYEDLTPQALVSSASEVPYNGAASPGREPGQGRPTKRDRRAIDKLMGGEDGP